MERKKDVGKKRGKQKRLNVGRKEGRKEGTSRRARR